MDLSILVKNHEGKSKEDLIDEGRKELLKLFGIEPNFWKRLRTGKRKSKLLTKDEIAKILLDSSLVNSLEQVLSEVEKMMNYNSFEYPITIKTKKVGEELKYWVKYIDKAFYEYYDKVIYD